MNKISPKLLRYIVFSIALLLTVGIIWVAYTSLPIIVKIFTIVITVLFPFVVSFLIAYILHPLITFIERKVHMKRWVIILLLYFAVFIILGSLVFFIIVPFVQKELSPLIEQLMDMSLIESAKQNLLSVLGESDFTNSLEIYIDELILRFRLSFTSDSPSIIVGFLGRIMSSFLNILLIPIILFYMLKDFEKILLFFKKVIVPKYRKTVINLFVRIDEKIGAYLRSQLFLMFVISVAATIGYAIIGLPHFYLFALIIGMTNVIPYIGAYIGLAPPILYILATGENYFLIILVIAVNILLQFLEGNFLQPVVMGKNLNYHPMLIILSMLFTSEFLGIVGIIFAVPILILVYETLKFVYEKKIMQYYVDIDFDTEFLSYDEHDFDNSDNTKEKSSHIKKKTLPKRSNEGV